MSFFNLYNKAKKNLNKSSFSQKNAISFNAYKILKKFGFSRVALRATNAGWGDAFYSKNNILVSRFYYFLVLRIKKLPIIMYDLLLRIFSKVLKKLKIR